MGLSGGLITGLYTNCTLINFFSIVSCLCIEFYCKELHFSFLFLNMYGPYKGREGFWSKLFSYNCLSSGNFIVGET
jgi:hypothetical protein